MFHRQGMGGKLEANLEVGVGGVQSVGAGGEHEGTACRLRPAVRPLH